jgi:hypothetical protein
VCAHDDQQGSFGFFFQKGGYNSHIVTDAETPKTFQFSRETMGAQSWMKEILNEKLQLFPEGSFKLCVFPGLGSHPLECCSSENREQ